MDAMKQYLNRPAHRRVRSRVWILQGSVLNDRDLQRAHFKEALLAFILPNLYVADQDREDVENALRALSIRKSAPYVRVVIVALKAEYRHMMLSVGLGKADVVCVNEIQLGILAKSCEVQGFTPLACNLVKTTAYPEAAKEKDAPEWIKDYGEGLNNEIYEIPMSPAYNGAPFGPVAMDILERSRGLAYLIGVIDDPIYPGDEVVIRVFPGSRFKIGTRDDRILKGIFICSERKLVRQHPPVGRMPWSMEAGDIEDAEMEEADMDPDQVIAARVNAKPIESGFIVDPRDAEDEAKEQLSEGMQRAAVRKAAAGLRHSGGMPREAIESSLGCKLSREVWQTGGILLLEQNADSQDANEQKVSSALARQQAQAKREEQEQRLERLQRDAAAQEQQELAQAKAAIAQAEYADNRANNNVSERDELQDNELWGCEPAPALPLYCNAREPPLELLLKGDHLLFVALERGMRQPAEKEHLAHQPTGKSLCLELFLKAVRVGDGVRRPVPIVVLAPRVPIDWPAAAQHPEVYLVVGPPLINANLIRAGVKSARAVVVHQRGPVTAKDATLVDAEAIFACRLVESIVQGVGREIPVVLNLMMDTNAAFVKLRSEAEPKKDQVAIEDLDWDMKESAMLEANAEEEATEFFMRPRYLSGQLFVSSITTSLAANMLYNQTLGLVVHEMMRTSFVVVPVPEDAEGTPCRKFCQVFEHLLKHRNLLALALIRSLGAEPDDEDAEEERIKNLAKDHKRWSSAVPPSDRFVFTMPTGKRLIAQDDGVLCIVAVGGSAAGSAAGITI